MKTVIEFVTKINKTRQKFNPCLSPSFKFSKIGKSTRKINIQFNSDKKTVNMGYRKITRAFAKSVNG